MLNDFEQGFESIRSWMDTVEGNLQRQFANPQSLAVRRQRQNERIDVSEF